MVKLLSGEYLIREHVWCLPEAAESLLLWMALGVNSLTTMRWGGSFYIFFSSSEEQQSVLDMLVYNLMAWGDRIKNLNGFSDDPKNILFKFSLYDVVTFLCSLRPVRSYVTYSTTWHRKELLKMLWKYFFFVVCPMQNGSKEQKINAISSDSFWLSPNSEIDVAKYWLKHEHELIDMIKKYFIIIPTSTYSHQNYDKNPMDKLPNRSI